MPAAVRLRADCFASDLRQITKASKDSDQSCRFLSLVAIVEGRSREEAARTADMDR
ncbi:hypothetical protein [Aestuariivirga sp.]|uniref:hypothetical protein n=1 Tax=Aestuariivirga sp. TaxID=2650926 RepID=UPI0037847B4D